MEGILRDRDESDVQFEELMRQLDAKQETLEIIQQQRSALEEKQADQQEQIVTLQSSKDKLESEINELRLKMENELRDMEADYSSEIL